MTQRWTTAVAAGVLAVLPLLGGCGSGSTPQAGPTTSVAAPAASATVATPSASRVDQTKQVQDAAKKFVTTAFGFDGHDSYADLRDRVKPLMTKEGFASFEAADLERSTTVFKARYGTQARTRTKVLGTPKVTTLTADQASVVVKVENRVEKRADGRWRVVRRAPDDTATLPLIEQDGRWLVDKIE